MIHATDTNFDEAIAGDIPVLVKFGAEWCGPCKSMAPILVDLESQYSGKVKFVSVDIDETQIAKRYAIRGVPTVLLIKEGSTYNVIVGAQTKGRLQLALDTLLGVAI